MYFRDADYELDYKSMFDALCNRVEKLRQQDDEYFALMRTLPSQNIYFTAVSENFLKLKKQDQIKVLKVITSYGKLCEELCSKYDLLDDEEIEEDEFDF